RWSISDCSVASGSWVFLVHFDKVSEVLDSEFSERHHPVVVEPVDPDDAVFGVHLIGDIEEPVHALAEFPGHAVYGFDGMDLVDVHDQAAWAGVIDSRDRQFQGSSSSNRCMGWAAIRDSTSESHVCGST